MSERYDFHCVLTAGGRNWRIVEMHGLSCIEASSLDGWEWIVLDLSQLDMETYCDRAARWAELYQPQPTVLDLTPEP